MLRDILTHLFTIIDDRWREWRDEKGGRKLINERHKERLATDPLFRLSKTMRSRLQVAITRGGFTKRSKTLEYLGADWEIVLEY